MIEYRGSPVQARKRFFDGTPRGATPLETLEKLGPYWNLIGLTRLANITGLDRIGIPVTLSIRPNSPDIGTNCGKGLTLQTALASAAMEAFEHHCGEAYSGEFFIETYESLETQCRIVPLQRLATSRNSLFHPARPEKWCFGWDLATNSDVAVPCDQVKVAYASEFAPASLSSFQSGTNGLASGNSLAEAISSALLELIERDSIACHCQTQDVTGRPPAVVTQDTIDSAVVTELLAQLRRAEVDTYIFDLTTDLEIPTFHVAILNRDGCGIAPGTGWGAALDVETALVRAITEAAQTRLVHLYGARDDTFRRKYEACMCQDAEQFRLTCSRNPRRVDINNIVSTRHDTFEEDISFILKKLLAAGLDQVIVLDLTPEGVKDLAGVRVIVPGLEGYRYEFYRPGERAIAHCNSESTGTNVAA